MRWRDEDLKLIERALAKVLGPMARVLVRRAAAAGHDHVDDLVQGLAGQLDTRDERRRFMDEIRALGGLRALPAVDALEETLPGTPAGPVEVPESQPMPVLVDEVRALTPEFIAHATVVLSAAMGPMAKVLVRQAEARASGRDAFVDALVQSVPDSVDRASLLARLQASL